jgi:hypothetical protein
MTTHHEIINLRWSHTSREDLISRVINMVMYS